MWNSFSTIDLFSSIYTITASVRYNLIVYFSYYNTLSYHHFDHLAALSQHDHSESSFGDSINFDNGWGGRRLCNRNIFGVLNVHT